MDQISVCKACPSRVISCSGDVLVLKKGFWRISESSDRIQSCPYGEAACEGGESVGDASCAVGYEGPLCAVCSVGYALKASTQTCVPCSNSSKLDISEILLLTLLGVLVIGVPLFFFSHPQIRAQIRSIDDLVLFVVTKLNLLTVSEGRTKQEVITFIKILSRRLKAKVKVYITMYQILSALPFVLDLTFPYPVNLIISGLCFLNMSLSNSAVVSCSTQSYDFIDYLIIDTTYPIVFVGLIFLVLRIHVAIVRFRAEKSPDPHSHNALENRLANISSTYFTVFLVFTYLILPFVVTKIFQTFRSCPPPLLPSLLLSCLSLTSVSCHDVDPDDSKPGPDSYMAADYSVSCSSRKYHFGLVWACVMVAIYPLGCPAYYFYLLYHVRHEIQAMDTETFCRESSDVEESSMSVELTDAARAKQAKLNSLSFLYESYQPRYWWWEIAETSQRLILTGVLVLIAQGSAFQIIVGAMLSLLFLHLNARYEPFSDGFVLSIKIVSYWQIFFVFWIALLIKADFPSIGSLSLGVCLIITIFMNIFLDLWKVCWAAVSSSRRVRWSSSRSRELRDENDTEPERGVRLASHTEMRAMDRSILKGN
jgi:heme/copper-type cytochrome/quinol oxidase subunit 2